MVVDVDDAMVKAISIIIIIVTIMRVDYIYLRKYASRCC